MPIWGMTKSPPSLDKKSTFIKIEFSDVIPKINNPELKFKLIEAAKQIESFIVDFE